MSVGGGYVAVWHRPPPRQVKLLADDGCTMLVTLQAEREKAPQVGSLAEKHGMKWVWCALEGANRALLGQKKVHAKVMDAVTQAAAEVRAGGSVCVHCAAGMHRTGVFTYVLARRLGLAEEEAMMMLLHTRPITYRGVGSFRIAVGEEIHAAFLSGSRPAGGGEDGEASVAAATAVAGGGAGAGAGAGEPGTVGSLGAPSGSAQAATATTAATVATAAKPNMRQTPAHGGPESAGASWEAAAAGSGQSSCTAAS